MLNSFILRWILAVCLLAGIGCTGKPKVSPVAVPPSERAQSQETSVPSVLMTEAQKLADENNYQDALLVYNQALSEAKNEQEKAAVTDAVEKLLIRTPPKIILEFSEIRNLTIPASMLTYWAGVNYAAAGESDAALEALTRFVTEYPDHSYVGAAKDMIEGLKRAAFRRDAIGCLLPLSGKYSVFGQKALKGIQMAVQDLSDAYGRPFKVVVKDTRSDPARAAECVEELYRDHVLGIVGPLLAPEAAGRKAESLRLPMIAMTQKEEFPLSGDYLFTNFITPKMQVEALGNYVFRKLGLTRVAILYPREKYGLTYMNLFWDVVDQFHGEVVGVESYDGDGTDFSVPLQKLTGEYYPVPDFLASSLSAIYGEAPENNPPGTDLDASAEEDGEGELKYSARGSITPNAERIKIDFQALFIPDALSRVNLILPQLAFHDARGMVLLGTNLWHQDRLLTEARGYNKNAVIADGYFGESKNPVTADFHDRFTALFGEAPGFLTAISYDTAKILFSAAMGEEVYSREDVKSVLQGGRFFEGVTGRTIFDKTGTPHKELFLITVKQGKFREIRP